MFVFVLRRCGRGWGGYDSRAVMSRNKSTFLKGAVNEW